MEQIVIVYGVDTGGTRIRIAPVNARTGEIIGGVEAIVRNSMNGFNTNEEVANYIASIIPPGSKIGISLTGNVDEVNLESRKAPNSRIKGSLNFPRLLNDRGYNVVATNDLRAAAQAAARFGEGINEDNVSTVTYSSGFDAAITRNKKNVTFAEIGHLVYDLASPLFCGCGGRGHLEPYVSANGAASMAQQYLLIRKLKDHPLITYALEEYNKGAVASGKPILEKRDLDDDAVRAAIVLSVSAKEVYRAFRESPDMEPQKSIQALQKEAIAHSFGLMVGAYNPLDMIVCMGSLTNAEQELMKPAREMYLQDIGRFQLDTLKVPRIVTTKLPEIGVQGAAAYFLSVRGAQ